MKILLDECLPIDLRHSFPTHDSHTAEWAGLKGKKNGELLAAAEIAGYDVLLTIDHAMPRQQNLVGRKLSLVLLRSRTRQIEDLLPMVDATIQALASIAPGQCIVIPLSD